MVVGDDISAITFLSTELYKEYDEPFVSSVTKGSEESRT
jgi:hypothetical protein